MKPGETIYSGALEIEPIHTPGPHRRDAVAARRTAPTCSPGDTLFKGSVGGVRAPGHTTYADLKSSIMDKLLKLPPETRIHPGHTDPTTVADELEHNPFVRIWRGLDPEGERAVHRARRAGDADPARRRLRRRPQGVGPLAGRLRRHRARLAGASAAAIRARARLASSRTWRRTRSPPRAWGVPRGSGGWPRGRRSARRAPARPTCPHQGGAQGRARAPPHRGRRADRRPRSGR